MNVLPAWRSCINGTGVTVGVVDMGIQNHFDLNVVSISFVVACKIIGLCRETHI